MLQLPQSTVSRHLKTLADAGWVSSRRDGTSRYYTLGARRRGGPRALGAAPRAGERRPPGPIRTRGASQTCSRAGRRQVAGVLRVGRRAVGQAARGSVRRRLYLAGAARAARRTMERRRPRLRHGPGRRRARAVRGARHRGRSFGRHAAGRAPRLRDLPNVDVARGELEALPIDDGALDAATLLLVLHHLPDPAAALCESARVLQARRPAAHRPTCCRTIARSTAADGARLARVRRRADPRLLASAGLERHQDRAHAARRQRARGPALFVATAIDTNADRQDTKERPKKG